MKHGDRGKVLLQEMNFFAWMAVNQKTIFCFCGFGYIHGRGQDIRDVERTICFFIL